MSLKSLWDIINFAKNEVEHAELNHRIENEATRRRQTAQVAYQNRDAIIRGQDRERERDVYVVQLEQQLQDVQSRLSRMESLFNQPREFLVESTAAVPATMNLLAMSSLPEKRKRELGETLEREAYSLGLRRALDEHAAGPGLREALEDNAAGPGLREAFDWVVSSPGDFPGTTPTLLNPSHRSRDDDDLID